MKKKAFTLAEVLITLTIIGVIAALTIPSLMQKHQEQEMVSRLKKSYTVLSNAFELAIRENGPVEDWDIGSSNTSSGAQKLYNYVKPYLKIRKYCGISRGCFAVSYKNMNNNAMWIDFDSASNVVKFLLEDGTAVSLWIYDANCKNDSICATLDMDINGKKGPNKAGFDVFAFVLFPEKLKPMNVKTSCKYKNTNNTNNGQSCAQWIILKSNMDYLRRDVSAEW